MVVTFLSLLAQTAAMPPKADPLAKKGPRAWSNARADPASGRNTFGVNRLHVHAVDDATNVSYVREVRAFLDQARRIDLAR